MLDKAKNIALSILSVLGLIIIVVVGLITSYMISALLAVSIFFYIIYKIYSHAEPTKKKQKKNEIKYSIDADYRSVY